MIQPEPTDHHQKTDTDTSSPPHEKDQIKDPSASPSEKSKTASAKESESDRSAAHSESGEKQGWLQNMISVIVGLFFRFFQNDVGTRAAALAYYMVFSIFPLLILAVLLVSRLPVNTAVIQQMLKPFLPGDIITLLENYFSYVKNSYNQALVNFALIFSIYFPWRAIRGLMKDVRISYGLKPLPFTPKAIGKELLCTLIMPLSLLTALLLFVFGERVISFLLTLFPEDTFSFSIMSLDLWDTLRFAIAAALMSAALGAVYQLSLDHREPIRAVLPGILAAIAVWLFSSTAFAYYVEHFGDYPVIYGTLGAFIVLLLWLYLSALIFIMGSEFNALLKERKQEKKAANKMRQRRQNAERTNL